MTDGNGIIPGDIDLLRPWFNPARAARLAALDAKGKIAVLTIRILLGEDGKPVKWSSSLACLEPRGGLEQMLELFGEE